MSRRRTLVVYYSRSGHTREVAREVAAALGADLEEIGEPTDRTGVLGYLKSALEAIWGASSEIGPPRFDPGSYELVVIGTPVWYAAVSTPVRTYLWVERDRLPRVAFFLTHGGMGSDRVFGQMSALAGKRPTAKLALRVREIEGGEQRGKVSSFAKSLLPSAARARGARTRGGRGKAVGPGGRGVARATREQ
jgi:flavodoxin